MKQTITITRDDGGAKGSTQNVAAQGQKGDTQLAHVNPWEAMLLKRLGGAGTTNPRTGLKQFYIDPTTGLENGLVYTGGSPTFDETAQGSGGIPGSSYTGTGTNGLPYGYGGTLPTEPATKTTTQNFGANPELNKYLANLTGYTGDFGGGQWQNYATANGINSNDLVSQWNNTFNKMNPIGNNSDPNGINRTAPVGASTPATTGTNVSGFNFPMDIMPTSSTSNSSTSYSGLPTQYQNQLLNALMPQLSSAITNMPGNIDEYTNQALGSYQQLMNNALKQNIPTALRTLANRGVLNSTEGQKVLGNVYSAAAQDAANKGYTTAMQAALLKANMPSTLATIGDLGKTSTTTSTGTSQTSDPTVMYSTMANLIKSMMG